MLQLTAKIKGFRENMGSKCGRIAEQCACMSAAFWLVYDTILNCSYCCRQVAASVSADPAQTADDIEHLELELHNRRSEAVNKWLLHC